MQKHLDDWLDGCLKDAPLTSSSSEFLDNNFPSLNHNGSTSSQPRGPTMINNHNNTTNHLQYSNNPTTASAAQAAAFYLNSNGGAGGGGGFSAPPKQQQPDTPTRSGAGMHDPFSAGYKRVSLSHVSRSFTLLTRRNVQLAIWIIIVRRKLNYMLNSIIWRCKLNLNKRE